MDRLDRKILRLLQEDSTLAVADVAKKVGLSTTPCWRRIQKLEEEGVIKRRVALLDPVKINTRAAPAAYSSRVSTSARGVAPLTRSVSPTRCDSYASNASRSRVTRPAAMSAGQKRLPGRA